MPMRGTFRSVGIAAAIVGLSAGGAAVDEVTAGTVVVVGTGDPARDVPAVQAAVDLGGVVLLEGTFDFGTHAGNHILVPGRVGSAQDDKGKSTVFVCRRDVTILGETDDRGNLLTTIRHGMPPFWIGWDGNVSRARPPGTANLDYGIESLPQDSVGRVSYRDTGPETGYQGPQTRYAVGFPQVNATIQHIRFESPRQYGIKATCGRNVAVLENIFQDVRWGGLVHLNNFAAASHFAVGFGAVGGFYAPFITPSVTGSVIFQGNRVEDVGTEIINTHGGECFGLGGLLTNAALTITGNDVRNVGRKPDGTGPGAFAASILLIDNRGGAPFVGNNTIQNSSAIGIWDLTAVSSSPSPLIVDNKIEDCPTGIEAGSWGPPKFGVVIRSNRISQGAAFKSGKACIKQSSASSYCIDLNVFRGAFDEGVRLVNCSNGLVLWNNAAALATPAGGATYYLGEASCGNTIRAQSGIVVSAGTCGNDVAVDEPGEP